MSNRFAALENLDNADNNRDNQPTKPNQTKPNPTLPYLPTYLPSNKLTPHSRVLFERLTVT